MPRRAAVLGTPIAHSLSPVLWRAAYAATGLDWSYDAIECDEAALPPLLRALAGSPDWAGLSLTMPLKLAAARLVDDLDPVAAAVGAVNTVVARSGRLLGVNTDAPGMVAALRAAGVAAPDTAVVVGGGGTARAALWALAALGVREPVVVVRDPAKGEPLAGLGRQLGTAPRIAPWSELHRAGRAGLTIVTTPAAAAADLGAIGPWERGAVLFDVVYEPWPTPVAALAAAAGATVVGGLDLLVHQAALGFELMTGRRAPVGVMQAAGLAALAARA